MDREANLPVPPAPPAPKNLVRRIPNQDTSSSSSSSSSSLSWQVQAAFKRHRTLGTMESSSIGPRRALVPQRAASRCSGLSVDLPVDTKKSQDVGQVHMVRDLIVQRKSSTSDVVETQEEASITLPTLTLEESFNRFDVIVSKESNPVPLSLAKSHHVDVEREVKISTVNNAGSHGADDRMATGMENLTFHMGSLALTEMESDACNQVEASTVVNHDLKNQNLRNAESSISLRSDGGGLSSLLAKRTTDGQDQLHQFRNIFSEPATQSSVMGSSCATTTSIHSTSAPMLNTTTFCSVSHRDRSSHMAGEPLGEHNANSQPLSQVYMQQPSNPLIKDTGGVLVDQRSTAAPTSKSAIQTNVEAKEYDLPKEQKGCVAKGNDFHNANSTKVEKYTGDVTDGQSHAPLSKNVSSDAKQYTFKSEKQEKAGISKGASGHRKRNYDPDLFFKVNGKLYQRLGKIGSGGSSEVHKVISSDCTIYALKKIKLKGRDSATALGFCQEIEYLNKLKGKNHIIQLIDYEVTDKALLREVLNGCLSNKDGRVKDDGYIYMVLEYGEIDLAHMLSQRWKEDSFNQSIDDNWLRFYWQQMLQAVNTIHEERIVHSDLKPANFLLVKGSLKLIDFGIAKAILSDTTNIQRDSQVGTLSYMSPEAFLCNENDANGNTIKCGRSSDIWSLGCILYQMVYGRTPFSEYKTFLAKFKVITDPTHRITYEPVSNPCLLDLMKKCLVWDRNERLSVPQLLQHPFLVPPIPHQPSSFQDQSCKLLQLLGEACGNDEDASMLISQLHQLLRDPVTPKTSELLASPYQQCKVLSQLAKLCLQLQECLEKSE
ncbi:LOW QUALITY PROTEIN: Pkinase domain-containing protein, partial [Cephalotus follicularis]